MRPLVVRFVFERGGAVQFSAEMCAVPAIGSLVVLKKEGLYDILWTVDEEVFTFDKDRYELLTVECLVSELK